MASAESLTQFERRLGVAFEDKDLLLQALTHRSARKKNNERLEFLGDAVLGMVIAEQLYLQSPESDEGDLSRYRSSLVRKEALAALAEAYQFSEVLLLGAGELRSGGVRHESILADAFEAVVGALLLDKGVSYVREFLIRIYQDQLDNLPEIESLKDAKTRLQEWLQARRMRVPIYETVHEKTDHPQRFEVRGWVEELSLDATASASSRRKAEQKAAELILAQLEND